MSAVDRLIAAAQVDEAGRLDRGRRSGAFPQGCGPGVEVAPARGPLRIVTGRAVYPKGADGFEVKHSGFAGRNTAVIADVFDIMAVRSGRQRFTPSQIAVARHYRNMVERHSAGGVRCASLEAMPGGSGNGGEFIDAFVAEGDSIRAMQRRIGGGVALEPRRAGRRRAAIQDAVLVDRVCLVQEPLAKVLRGHGWSVCGDHVEVLARALCAALDRMGCTLGRGRIVSVRK